MEDEVDRERIRHNRERVAAIKREWETLPTMIGRYVPKEDPNVVAVVDPNATITRVYSFREYCDASIENNWTVGGDVARSLFVDGRAKWVDVDREGVVVAALSPAGRVVRGDFIEVVEPPISGIVCHWNGGKNPRHVASIEVVEPSYYVGVDLAYLKKESAVGEMSDYHRNDDPPAPRNDCWRTREGDLLPPETMEDRHLRNALMVCWRLADAWRWATALEMSRHELNGEHANDAVDSELSALGALGPTELLKRSPQWERVRCLVDEWARRCALYPAGPTYDSWFDPTKTRRRRWESEAAERSDHRCRMWIRIGGVDVRVDAVESTADGLVLRRRRVSGVETPLYAQCLEGDELRVDVADVSSAYLTSYVFKVAERVDMPLRLGTAHADDTEAVLFRAPVMKSRRVTAMEAEAAK